MRNDDFAKKASKDNPFYTHQDSVNNRTINIAYATDDNYAEFTGVSMASIMYHTKSDIHFYIVEKSLSQQNKDKLSSICDKGNCKITFRRFVIEDESCLMFEDHWPIEAWYRLFLSDIFPELDRMLWIDSDIIAEGDILELWRFDLGENFAAAANPTPSDSQRINRLLSKTKLLEIDWYFNSGVMLFDLRLIRKSHIFSSLNSMAPSIYKKLKEANLRWAPDQDVLNVLLNKRVALLPPKMNAYAPNCKLIYNDLSSLESWVEAIMFPTLVHFAAAKPSPLTHQCDFTDLVYVRKYYFYKAMTPFFDSNDKVKLDKYENHRRMFNHPFIYGKMDYIFYNMKDTFKSFATQLQTILNTKKLALWGAGITIRTMMVEFAAMGIYADLIVDGLIENHGATVFDHSVQNPKVLDGKASEYFVLLSVVRQELAARAADKLETYGYNKGQYHHIFSPLWDFINGEL